MLGKLKKIDLRKAWPHEATDFTKWLSEDKSIEELSDELGIDIKVIETEANVGKFKLDILAEEEGTGRKVIIENQLEDTNHDHLGKLITYASGLEAEIIIWIVKGVREEHQNAIDWLNEHTDEHLNFFLVKLEVWQIADSPMAPKFHIICQPNDWAKSVKQTSEKLVLTVTKKDQWDFWNEFKKYAENTNLKLTKTYPQHWYNISCGSSDAHLALTINTRENVYGCELYIPNNKDLFNELLERKGIIENELGKLQWMELPGRKASRIRITKKGDFGDKSAWPKAFEWLSKQAESFNKVFSNELKKFK